MNGYLFMSVQSPEIKIIFFFKLGIRLSHRGSPGSLLFPKWSKTCKPNHGSREGISNVLCF